MSEWETFCDESYYHLWRVRRKSERNFNDGVHVQDGKGAAALVELLNRLERERDEAREEAKRLEGAYEDATNYYARIIELVDERDKFRNALREIASATGFDNIGNWARNTARKALEEIK
jgi:predicted ribosome quality control (RQC) complex YloA/Tae2 family protein